MTEKLQLVDLYQKNLNLKIHKIVNKFQSENERWRKYDEDNMKLIEVLRKKETMNYELNNYSDSNLSFPFGFNSEDEYNRLSLAEELSYNDQHQFSIAAESNETPVN